MRCRRPNTRSLLGVGAVAVLAAFLVACGGGAGTVAPPTQTPSSSTPAPMACNPNPTSVEAAPDAHGLRPPPRGPRPPYVAGLLALKFAGSENDPNITAALARTGAHESAP